MSWFAEEELELAGVEVDACCGQEIADGVIVERRRVLQVSAGIAGALLLAGGARAARGRAAPGPAPVDSLELRDLLDTMLPMARELVRTGKGETSYLFKVCELVARLKDPTASPREAMRAFKKEHAREDERFPIHVTQLRLKPGARLSHHDHRDYNGVIVGVSGEVRVRNYDILGEAAVPPEGKTFEIRETQDSLIAPGRYSTLERRRNNVHDLRGGPEGGVVLDLFTFFEKGATSRWMDVEDKPRDAERRIYEASWRPRRRRSRERKKG